MSTSIFLKTIRDSRWALFWFCLGFCALSLYLMYFYPYISRHREIIGVLDKLPPFIKNFIGETALLTTPEGFFNLQPFSMFAPLLFLIFAVIKGNDLIGGEKEQGTLDLLLANPVSRFRVISEKFLAVVIMMLTIALVFWLAMFFSCLVFNISLNKLNLLAVIISCWLLGVVIAAMTLFFSCLLLKKKLASGIVSGFIVVTYLINAYAPMVDALKPYRHASPFYYYNGAAPLLNGLNWNHLFVQVSVAVLFFTLAVIVFRTRDLV